MDERGRESGQRSASSSCGVGSLITYFFCFYVSCTGLRLKACRTLNQSWRFGPIGTGTQGPRSKERSAEKNRQGGSMESGRTAEGPGPVT